MSEILVLGCGRYTEPVNPELRQFIRSTGMKLEAVDTVLFVWNYVACSVVEFVLIYKVITFHASENQDFELSYESVTIGGKQYILCLG